MLFPTLHSYVIPSRLCTPNISWKYVGLIVKHPREIELRNVVEVSVAPSVKIEDTEAVCHFEEYNYDENDLHATLTKSIILFNS